MNITKQLLKELNEHYSIEDIMSKSEDNMSIRPDADRISFVDIKLLDEIKEFDRKVQRVRTDESVEDLKKAIIENGITDSCHIDFCPYDGTIKLAEGNHRLMIAKELGLPSLPCTCIRSNNEVNNYKMKLNPDNITPREDGEYGKYYYNPMNPEMLGEPFGPNYKSN